MPKRVDSVYWAALRIEYLTCCFNLVQVTFLAYSRCKTKRHYLKQVSSRGRVVERGVGVIYIVPTKSFLPFLCNDTLKPHIGVCKCFRAFCFAVSFLRRFGFYLSRFRCEELTQSFIVHLTDFTVKVTSFVSSALCRC